VAGGRIEEVTENNLVNSQFTVHNSLFTVHCSQHRKSNCFPQP